jgi:competence protein ComEA
MKWTEIARDYLTFTRKERIGILTILSLIIITIFLPAFFSSRAATNQQKPDTTWIAAIKQLEQKEMAHEKTGADENNTGPYQYDLSVTSINNKSRGELFPFDPNTLSKEGWKKLGIRDKTIQTIQNYLTKGGHFNKPEDLQRIYGLYQDEYERLAPYIKIETKATGHNRPDETKVFADYNPAVKKATHHNQINVNAADTTAFISLPGIGSKLANRIINFREKLGGFYTIEQVKETFGLPDSTFQKIKPYLVLENVVVKKVNINTAGIDELKVHPYIRFNIANAIVAYRNQHGPFSDLQDLKKIMIITDDLYEKITPYFVLSN